jgi:hypothetical protein
MKITVVGTGYVGLVSGTCLAEVGNDVLCLDVDPEKIRILEEGGIPIYEPGLQDMVRRNVAAGRLRFTTDIEKAVQHGTIQFIAVGTPPDEDGSADLQYVLGAARNIGRLMTDYKVVVDKSTVPVGTGAKNVLQVGRTVFIGRRADGDELDGAVLNGLFDVGGEAQAAGRDIAADHVLQARFVDRNAAFLKDADLLRIDVQTEDVIAHFGQTGTTDQTDITGADNSNFHETSYRD